LSDALVMPLSESSVVACKPGSADGPAQGLLQWSVQGTDMYPA